MGIAVTAYKIITEALEEAHELGSTPALKARFNLNNARAALLTGLDLAGYEVVRKTKPKPFIGGTDPEVLKPVEIKLPDGSIHGWLRGGEVLKPGTVSLLTPEAERIIQSVREGVRGHLDKLVVGYAERPITPEDFTGIKLERGEGLEAPKVYVDSTPGKADEGQESAADLARRVDPAWCYRNDPAYRARHDQAVRDCLEASRLTYAAAEVIGHGAVSEILNSAEPPAEKPDRIHTRALHAYDDLGEPTGRSYLVTTLHADGRERHVVHREYVKDMGLPGERT